jgi:hypothetical protein
MHNHPGQTAHRTPATLPTSCPDFTEAELLAFGHAYSVADDTDALDRRKVATTVPRLSLLGKQAANQNLLNDFEHDEKVRAYRIKLAATTETEWRYRTADRSADHNHGARHFAMLQVLQIELDPRGAIWHEFMPEGLDIPGPRVMAVQS